MGSFLDVNYTASSDLFQAIGYTTDYANGSVSLSPAGDFGAYILTANITGAGVLTGGSMSLAGDIGSGQETLLAGTLTALGYNNSGGNIFEFLFTVTGGNAAVVSDFGGLGASGGIIIDAWFQNSPSTPFTGSWTSDFFNDGWSGVSDPHPLTVPEPSSILVTLLGAALWAGLIIVSAGHNSLNAAALRNA